MQPSGSLPPSPPPLVQIIDGRLIVNPAEPSPSPR